MNGYRGRVAIVVALIATGVLSTPSNAAGPITLAGTTVLTVSRTASVDVRLPKAVSLPTPFGGGPDIGVMGGEALTAFVMVSTDPRKAAFTLAGGAAQLNGQTERFLMPVPQWPSLGGGSYEESKTFGDTTVVPAGTYRIYVLSTGRASITLRLPGLRGRVTLSPQRGVVGSITAPDHEVVSSPASGNTYAASTTHVLARRGFAMHVLLSHAEADAAWQLLMCHDNPSSAAVDTLKEIPGCPSGEKHTVVDRRFPETDPGTKIFVQAFAGLLAGEQGVSAIYTNEGNATGIAYSTLWLEY